MRSFTMNLPKPDPKAVIEMEEIKRTASPENMAKLYERMDNKQDPNGKLRIVHLDDHCIYQWGLMKTIDPDESKIEFFQFQHSSPALEFIKMAFEKDYHIDCITTDFRHLGLNGYEFAKAVRLLEKESNKKNMPILLLTLVNAETKEIQSGIKNSYFSFYIEKNTNSNVIWNYFENLKIPKAKKLTLNE